jgi:hypothetical protein
MRKLSEFVKESIEINEKVFDLTFQVTHDMFVYSTNGKPIALHMKLDGGDNSLYETVPDGGALFFPYKFENGKNWGLVKVSPKNKRDMKVVSDLVKKISGKEIDSNTFKSGGFPHPGPVVVEPSKSTYTISVLEFDQDKLKKALGTLDSQFYVYSKSNALTGIAGIDRRYCWDPIKKAAGGQIIK